MAMTSAAIASAEVALASGVSALAELNDGGTVNGPRGDDDQKVSNLIRKVFNFAYLATVFMMWPDVFMAPKTLWLSSPGNSQG